MSSIRSSPLADRSIAGPDVPAARFGAAGMVRRVVVQTLFFALPSAALFARGNAILAGRVFWLCLGLVLLRNVIAGRRDELLALVLASFPFANLLRGTVFFHIVPAMVCAALVYWYASARGALGALSRTYPLLKWLAAYFAAYYLLTLIVTHQYEINLRVTECLFGAVTVLTLGRRRSLLAAAFVGFVVSATLLGLAFVPHLDGPNEPPRHGRSRGTADG